MAKNEPGSPEWWLRQLHSRIQTRRYYTALYRDYIDGEHRLAFASSKFRQHFGNLFNAFADNWCETIINASVERMNVEGFRVGPEDEGADKEAWEIWQRNDLDSVSSLAWMESQVSGEAVAVVWYDEDNEGKALINMEQADNAVVAVDARNPQKRIAGLRVYLDEWGYEHAELFLPTEVHLYKSKTTRAGAYTSVNSARVQWVPDQIVNTAIVDGVGAVIPNPLNNIPLVPITNNPRLWVRKEDCAIGSELNPIVPLQDAVNKLIADMMVGSEAAAVPLRWVTGYTPEMDTDGNPKPPPWVQDDKMWAVLKSESGKFGSLEAVDIQNYVKAIELLVQHVASISRTPPHYLNTSADRLSGESIKSAETGLVAKVMRKQQIVGEACEEIIRIAGALEGNQTLAEAFQAETLWRDPESRTESEHIDSVVKRRQGLDIPLKQAWADAGYGPTAIARMEAMLEEEQAKAMERAQQMAEVMGTHDPNTDPADPANQDKPPLEPKPPQNPTGV